MESQVCVHCLNKKVINSTTNRLVTESCGHVKCMDCLLHEKAGCVTCLAQESPKDPEGSPEASEGPPPEDPDAEPEAVHTVFPYPHFLQGDNGKEPQKVFNRENAAENSSVKNDKKKKLETSHIRVETDGNKRYYFCTACKRKFHARSQVSYHAYCNGQQKPHQCPECNKSFASHSHFQYHMRVHRDERTYACEECGDSFFQMSKLQRHRLKHTKEKKYGCPECSKAFNNPASLRKHARTHSGERPYACAACGRRFRDSSNLRKHAAKHAGAGCARACGCGACGRRRARAHVCPRCPQAFSARRDMRRHAAVHSDWKPFRCRVCSRRFRRKDNLERHVRNTHPAAAAAAADEHAAADADPSHAADEKTKLQSLNPLPPLPLEVIEKHLHDDKVQKPAEQKAPEPPAAAPAPAPVPAPVPAPAPAPAQGLAEILAANHARRSVIMSARRAEPPEYVHKIRKANRRLPALLPPIDESKFAKLANLDLQNELDVGAPPEKFRELYKKILYERSEKELDEQHWKKKKLTLTDM